MGAAAEIERVADCLVISEFKGPVLKERLKKIQYAVFRKSIALPEDPVELQDNRSIDEEDIILTQPLKQQLHKCTLPRIVIDGKPYQ